MQAAEQSGDVDEVRTIGVLVVEPWRFDRRFAVNEGEDLAAEIVEPAESWSGVEPDSLEMNEERFDEFCPRCARSVDGVTDADDLADVGAAATECLLVIHAASLA